MAKADAAFWKRPLEQRPGRQADAEGTNAANGKTDAGVWEKMPLPRWFAAWA
jgi:hypothetical protein